MPENTDTPKTTEPASSESPSTDWSPPLDPLRSAYSRAEIVQKMNDWMLEIEGHPLKMESDRRDQWYRDNGMLYAFLSAQFPVEDSQGDSQSPTNKLMNTLKRTNGTLLESADLLAVLSEIKDYIEEKEECIDEEWGSCRDFGEIHKAGEVTKTYDLICEILSANVQELTPPLTGGAETGNKL